MADRVADVDRGLVFCGQLLDLPMDLFYVYINSYTVYTHPGITIHT